MHKKHDEGYALVFVLVVMVVLSIIAISLLSGALQNLQSQTASVERMKAKYQAQGEIEMMMAQLPAELENLFAVNEGGNALSTTNRVNLADIQPLFQSMIIDVLEYEYDGIEWDNLDCRISYSRTDEKGIATINCVIIFENALRQEDEVFFLNKPTGLRYDSYTVSYASPTEPSEGGDRS